MKKWGIYVSVVLMTVFTSCSNRVKEQTFEGIVYDASMNNIILVTDKNDTVDISTMNANPEKVPGVLINDSIKVTCEDKVIDGNRILTATALKILAHSPYYYIQGTWLEPNPINDKEMQGFTLNQNGSAASVKMATLNFTDWNLDNRTLTLGYQSIGNGQTINGTDTLQVAKIDADSLVLTSKGNIIWKMGRKR